MLFATPRKKETPRTSDLINILLFQVLFLVTSESTGLRQQ